MNNIQPKKILVVKLQALGDILMVTPAIRLLKENHPQYTIDHLVFNRYKIVTKNNKCFNRIIGIDEKKCTIGGLYYLLRVYLSIRSEQYYYIINFHPNRTIRLICGLLGAKKVFHTNIKIKKKRKYHAVTFQDVIIQNFKGTENGLIHPKMDFMINFRNVNQMNFSSLQNYLCIHAGGGNNIGESTRIKHWPIEKYIQLIAIISREFPIHILLTGNSEDHEIMGTIIKQNDKAINLCGKTNLDELAFIFSKSRVNISGDTGAMHLAATTNAPLIALFGPTDPVQLLPHGPAITLIKTPLNCAPCYFGRFKGCRTGLENCMQAITVDSVFECVKKLLFPNLLP